MGEKYRRNILTNFWIVNCFYAAVKLHIRVLFKTEFFL